ncbi:MAG: hypothetical protein FJ317_05515, partial [SAR202 cluster bacterium]|nr:hypothetical protein [SAR202 cluster bacterium]
MSEPLSAGLADALERARLAARIRDLTGLPKPPSFRGAPRRARLATRLADTAARASVDSATRDWLLRALRVLALGRKGWAVPKTRGAGVPAGPTGQFPGYVTSSAGEETVVRLALLLRLMRQERQALDLLARRMQSGLPDREARWWFAHLLEQLGEKKARALTNAQAPEPLPVSDKAPASGAPRYAIIMLAMFDSPVFRSSLFSLVASD